MTRPQTVGRINEPQTEAKITWRKMVSSIIHSQQHYVYYVNDFTTLSMALDQALLENGKDQLCCLFFILSSGSRSRVVTDVYWNTWSLLVLKL